jgi:predicted ATPase
MRKPSLFMMAHLHDRTPSPAIAKLAEALREMAGQISASKRRRRQYGGSEIASFLPRRLNFRRGRRRRGDHVRDQFVPQQNLRWIGAVQGEHTVAVGE